MYNTQQKVLIVLSTLGVSTALKWQKFFQRIGGIDVLWKDKERLADLITSVFDKTVYDKLSFSLSDFFFDDIMRKFENKGIQVVTFIDSDYSYMLKEIHDPPLVLFCKGNIDLLNMPSIAIVGSRKCTYYGKRVAETFVAGLSNQFCIVSGLANGIDTVAHKKALELNAKTIAVLGGGFDHVYPSNNISLAERIAQLGLLVSEYNPNVEPNSYRFPVRNRIITGLSKGVIVAEAGKKSGVFSTVESASQQNRDVFVVPGDIFSYASVGSNELLKNYRNTLVTSPQDVIDAYGITFVAKQKTAKKLSYQPDIQEEKVLKTLDNGDKLHFDVIVQKSGLSASEVNYLLTNLELFDIVSKLNGNFYQLKTEASDEISYS